MPPRSKLTWNISIVPSQAELRLATPHQPVQAKNANEVGAGPQQQQKNPADNTKFFIDVLQSIQHSQQQLMEEICQLKADMMKEMGSQHDPKHVAVRKRLLWVVAHRTRNNVLSRLLTQQHCQNKKKPRRLRKDFIQANLCIP